jgi:hypothetical protein
MVPAMVFLSVLGLRLFYSDAAWRTALETDRFNRPKQDSARRKTDPYVDFIRQTLAQYPRLRSTWIFQMIRARGRKLLR